jgi:hypothetical protein
MQALVAKEWFKTCCCFLTAIKMTARFTFSRTYQPNLSEEESTRIVVDRLQQLVSVGMTSEHDGEQYTMKMEHKTLKDLKAPFKRENAVPPNKPYYLLLQILHVKRGKDKKKEVMISQYHVAHLLEERLSKTSTSTT